MCIGVSVKLNMNYFWCMLSKIFAKISTKMKPLTNLGCKCHIFPVSWDLHISVQISSYYILLGLIVSPTADPEVARLIMKYFLRSFSFFRWFKKGCCLLQARVCAQNTGKPLSQVCPGKSVVWWTDCLHMTIAVDWGVKPQTKHIDVAPITQLRTCIIKIVAFKGGHLMW